MNDQNSPVGSWFNEYLLEDYKTHNVNLVAEAANWLLTEGRELPARSVRRWIAAQSDTPFQAVAHYRGTRDLAGLE